MRSRFQSTLWMTRKGASVPCGAEAASFCPERRNTRKSPFALALILDTMVMVSIFAFLGAAGLVLTALLLLAGILLIILARVCRAGAPERGLLFL